GGIPGQLFRPRCEIGPQPIQGLAAPVSLFFAVEFVGVLAEAAAGQGGGAGGNVAAPNARVVRQLGLGGESFRVEAGGHAGPAFDTTERAKFSPLRGTSRHAFAFEKGGQLLVQPDQAFALPHNLSRVGSPTRVLGTEFVTEAQLAQGLAELAPLPKRQTQV